MQLWSWANTTHLLQRRTRQYLWTVVKCSAVGGSLWSTTFVGTPPPPPGKHCSAPDSPEPSSALHSLSQTFSGRSGCFLDRNDIFICLLIEVIRELLSMFKIFEAKKTWLVHEECTPHCCAWGANTQHCLAPGSAKTFWCGPKSSSEFSRSKSFVRIYFCGKYFAMKYQF